LPVSNAQTPGNDTRFLNTRKWKKLFPFLRKPDYTTGIICKSEQRIILSWIVFSVRLVGGKGKYRIRDGNGICFPLISGNPCQIFFEIKWKTKACIFQRTKTGGHGCEAIRHKNRICRPGNATAFLPERLSMHLWKNQKHKNRNQESGLGKAQFCKWRRLQFSLYSFRQGSPFGT